MRKKKTAKERRRWAGVFAALKKSKNQNRYITFLEDLCYTTYLHELKML